MHVIVIVVMYRFKASPGKKTHSYRTRRIVVLAVVCLLFVVIAITSLVVRHTNSNKTYDSTSVKERQINSVDYSPSKPSDNTANEDRKSSENPPQTIPSANTPNTSQGSVTVTRVSTLAGNLQVGTLLSGITAGTCTLTLSQTGQTTITRQNNVAASNNTFSCPTFTIPVTDFPIKTGWNVNIVVTNGSTNATSIWQANPITITE